MLLAAAACGRLAEGDPKGRDGNAKPVATTLVVKNSVRRSVDVVGTLAAVAQVTISSEAEGTVRAILADLGDRVATGQVLIQLDHEKQQYTYEQQQAALARTLAQYGASDPQHLPDVEKTPDVQKANADLAQARQAFERADELFKRTLISRQSLEDAQTALQSRQASYDSALQNARN